MSYINGGSIIAIGIVFPVLGAAAVAARFGVRHKRNTALGVDDWLCIPALVRNIIYKKRSRFGSPLTHLSATSGFRNWLWCFLDCR